MNNLNQRGAAAGAGQKKKKKMYKPETDRRLDSKNPSQNTNRERRVENACSQDGTSGLFSFATARHCEPVKANHNTCGCNQVCTKNWPAKATVPLTTGPYRAMVEAGWAE